MHMQFISYHFPHTAPRTPFSTYTGLRCYPFWTMPVWYGTPTTRRTNYFLRESNCLQLELQQNPGLRNRLVFLPASTSHQWWTTSHIWNLYFFVNNYYNLLLELFPFLPHTLYPLHVKLWNCLPPDIACTSPSSFKCAFKICTSPELVLHCDYLQVCIAKHLL